MTQQEKYKLFSLAQSIDGIKKKGEKTLRKEVQ
jgi:hypothetical protein